LNVLLNSRNKIIDDSRQIQNIIFDLGGVLIEWAPDGIIAQFTQNAELAARLKREIFDHRDWSEKDRGIISAADLNRGFAERTGLAEAQIAELMQIILPTLGLISATLPMMDELSERGLRLYCLSNMPVEHYDYLRQKYDFWDKFDGIVISGCVRLVKPEAEIYQYLLSEYQLEPEKCIFLDDSPKNITAAQEQGIQGIVFQDADSCREALKAMGVFADEN
jgi:putative hydrolase of the HAD superfamily